MLPEGWIQRFRTSAGQFFSLTHWHQSGSCCRGHELVVRGGSLAADSTTQAIRDNGVMLGTEANPSALINGEPNPAQDAFADACNSAFPLNS